jgi:hypothetical protein
MKSSKKIIIATSVVFLLMQLYRPARAIDYEAVSVMHLNTYTVPANVKAFAKLLL